MDDERGRTEMRRRSRRNFFKEAAAAAMVASQPIRPGQASAQGRKVSIFVQSDASDTSVRQDPVLWAVGELRNAFDGRQLAVQVHHNFDRIHDEAERILVAPGSSAPTPPMPRQLLRASAMTGCPDIAAACMLWNHSGPLP